MQPKQHEGGLATQQPVTQRPMTELDYQHLQHRFHDAGNIQEGCGYLAVALSQKAGWTFDQIANFLGLNQADVQNWIQQYTIHGLDGLRNLKAPQRANRT